MSVCQCVCYTGGQTICLSLGTTIFYTQYGGGQNTFPHGVRQTFLHYSISAIRRDKHGGGDDDVGGEVDDHVCEVNTLCKS